VTDRYWRITTPAVDLSDPEDGPRTDTVLAVVAPAEPDPDDDDGDEDAPVESAPAAAGATVSEDDGSSPEDGRAGGRWRTPLFVLAILAVVALAVGAVAFVSRMGWVVGDDGGQVALFRGQKGGVLWIQPTLEDRSDLRVDELQPADRRKVEEGLKYGDEADARAYIANLEKRAATTTTSTTTTTTTTLVLPTVTTAPAPGTAAPTPAVPAPAPAVPGP
jgi:hypothetical protein